MLASGLGIDDHVRVWMIMDSPVGSLRLVVEDDELIAIDFSPFSAALDDGEQKIFAELESDSVLQQAADQLAAYFAGELRDFDLPLAPHGTLFQQQVWQTLQSIPYGETVTYKDIADRLGKPKATRAVGSANSRNPLPIVIPCHRVIGKDGTLTGYAGGLSRKQCLLGIESSSKS